MTDQAGLRSFKSLRDAEKGDSIEFVYRGVKVTGKVVHVKKNGVKTVALGEVHLNYFDERWVDVRCDARKGSLMKVYIVYVDGEEVRPYIKAGSHNAAERKAQAKYPGQSVSVAYTEV